jgi:hypothetical protein
MAGFFTPPYGLLFRGVQATALYNRRSLSLALETVNREQSVSAGLRLIRTRRTQR